MMRVPSYIDPVEEPIRSAIWSRDSHTGLWYSCHGAHTTGPAADQGSTRQDTQRHLRTNLAIKIKLENSFILEL